MKHLKYFESKSDFEFHMEQIKDSLQEVIDEFGLDRFGDGMGIPDRHDDLLGYVYMLEKSQSHNFLDVTIFYRLKGSETFTPEILERMDEIRSSPEIRSFEKRLESMGYYIKKYASTTSYMVDVYLENTMK